MEKKLDEKKSGIGKEWVLLGIAAMLFLGTMLVLGVIIGIALPNFANLGQQKQPAVAGNSTLGNPAAKTAGQNQPGSVKGSQGNASNIGNANAGMAQPNKTAETLPQICGALGKDSVLAFSAIGDNGYMYNESEAIANGSYLATFQKGLLYDLKSGQVKFMGGDYTVKEVQPPDCMPDYRVMMSIGNSFDYNGYSVKLNDVRLPVCSGCPAIADVKVTHGNETFEKEFIPLTGTRTALGNLSRLGLQVLDTRYDLGLVELSVCTDDGGHVTLSGGYKQPAIMSSDEKTVAGYRLDMTNIRENGQFADLEIRNPIGLEGRVFGVKPSQRFLYITANGTTLFIQTSPFSVSPDGFQNEKDVVLQQGTPFCKQQVSLNWTTLQGGDEADALTQIRISNASKSS